MAHTILDLSGETTAELRSTLTRFRTHLDPFGGQTLETRIATDVCHALRVEIETRREAARKRFEVEYLAYAQTQPGDFLSRGDAEECLHHDNTTEPQKAWLRDFLRRYESDEV